MQEGNRAIRMVVVGAGDRGRTYAAYAKEAPEALEIVGVAEPNAASRAYFAERYGLPAERQWRDWREAVAARPDADVVAVCTPDALHLEPAVAFLDAGYHLLLEKPMARSWEECQRLAEKVRETRRLVLVGHVLRYTNYFTHLKAVLDAGEIGEIVSIQHMEPVAYMHAAHSFCRGNWGNAARSTPMILQKCCHDFDQFVWWLGRRCLRVSSFGGLTHFRPENRPAGAPERCLDCPAAIERACPFSVRKIYLERTTYRYPFVDQSDQGMERMLRDSPYGRCVYACDNDVVDHQIVNLLFEGGVTVSHIMESYTYTGGRETKIFGTRGEIIGNGRTLKICRFSDRTVTEWDSVLEAGVVGSGHGGGDFGIVRELIRQLRHGTEADHLQAFERSLESHKIAFAAERSRLAQGEVQVLR
ncbi:MAG: Gfo/Idh/MocA family oxidoreductase [Kiritimatiellae bacterium]|nr:Gfo/Idh/MocA family oxidoreductase [Kiritimatiellia bacterium]